MKIVNILSDGHFYSLQGLELPPTMVECQRTFWVLVALELLFQHF